MKSEIMKKWVAALESGEYKQGSGRLYAKGKYCCLGVLCEIAKKEGAIKDYLRDNGDLPWAVQDWAGMKTSFGGITNTNITNNVTLTGLNDGNINLTKQIKTKEGNISVRHGRKMSFKNIAKVIREYYANL